MTSRGRLRDVRRLGFLRPDGDTLTYAWDLNSDDDFTDAAGVSPALTWSQLVALGINDGPATHPVRVRVNDGQGHVVDSLATSLTVHNTAPTVGPITAPISPSPVSTTITATASFTDPGRPTRTRPIWDWGDTPPRRAP